MIFEAGDRSCVGMIIIYYAPQSRCLSPYSARQFFFLMIREADAYLISSTRQMHVPNPANHFAHPSLLRKWTLYPFTYIHAPRCWPSYEFVLQLASGGANSFPRRAYPTWRTLETILALEVLIPSLRSFLRCWFLPQ